MLVSVGMSIDPQERGIGAFDGSHGHEGGDGKKQLSSGSHRAYSIRIHEAAVAARKPY